ncbi:MAG: methylated-DNA--[protein]-cysteine S-methyltransferase [Planctomycetaceae bacterium]|nr:methylated-DNA--[protein]-cysteine S-methyltransferase [Planctomycetaceae bacterium]
MNTLPPIDEMQRAYLELDASYNGVFFLAVKTTGIFCRPTCPARKPLPRNVEYFATAEEAMAAGFRACKRCRPLEWDDEPAWATALLNDIRRDPTSRITDHDLCERGIDPATVRRHFQRRYGMTFHAFARAQRLTGALEQLNGAGTLDDAVFESGYDSHSGFREAFVQMFGETPGRSRNGHFVRLSWFCSPLGPLVAGATDEGVCLLEFNEQERLQSQCDALRKQLGQPLVPGSHRHLDQLEEQLAEYFAGSLREFTVPLLYSGTEFQQRVWQGLLAIPYGETRSYEQLANDIGSPTAARAVGRTNGLNRISIVIPCHRVVSKNGTLCGYGGGLRRKEFLLNLEQQHRRAGDDSPLTG